MWKMAREQKIFDNGEIYDRLYGDSYYRPDKSVLRDEKKQDIKDIMSKLAERKKSENGDSYDSIFSRINKKGALLFAAITLLGAGIISGLTYYQNGNNHPRINTKKEASIVAEDYLFGKGMITKENGFLSIKKAEAYAKPAMETLQEKYKLEQATHYNASEQEDNAKILHEQAYGAKEAADKQIEVKMARNDKTTYNRQSLEKIAEHGLIKPRIVEDNGGVKRMEETKDDKEQANTGITRYVEDVANTDRELAAAKQSYIQEFSVFYNNERISKKEKMRLAGQLVYNYYDVINSLKGDLITNGNYQDYNAKEEEFLKCKRDVLDAKRRLIITGEEFLADARKLYEKIGLEREERTARIDELVDEHKDNIRRHTAGLKSRLMNEQLSEKQLEDLLSIYSKGLVED